MEGNCESRFQSDLYNITWTLWSLQKMSGKSDFSGGPFSFIEQINYIKFISELQQNYSRNKGSLAKGCLCFLSALHNVELSSF